jgi:tRNA U34 5-carboxymethylaminomethyl modifying GTPase MnmE/TrmE
MKKFLQGAVLPFTIFATGLILLGCDQAGRDQPTSEATTDSANIADEIQPMSEQQDATPSDLKQGNLFYIVRDVTDLQLSTNDYTQQLKQTQSDLQKAVDLQDHAQLQQAATQLQQQLQAFDSALNKVQLKSQEISDIRQNILDANQQVLNSPFLNGQVDLSQVDFKKIEQQMGNIQGEMLKLAAMLIQQPKDQNPDSDSTS